MEKIFQTLEKLLSENKGRTAHLPAIKPNYMIHVGDTESFIINLKTGKIMDNKATDTDCTISIESLDVLEQIISDSSKAWAFSGNKKITTTDKFSAAILLESIFPGTLASSLSERQFYALFPHLVPNEYANLKTEDFFERVIPMKLKNNSGLLSTVIAAYQFDIENAGTWTIDMTAIPSRVYKGPAKMKGSIISTDRDTFEEILNDDSKAWFYFNSGKVSATNACRASQVVNAFWPAAFAKAMPPSLHTSLFPNAMADPSAPEYNKTTGDYITYIYGKDGMIPIHYSRLGEWAIYEGDILLGTVAEMEAVKNHVENKTAMPEGIRIINWGNPSHYLWPDGVVYYEVEGGHEPSKKVKDAMDHWIAKTKITFKKRVSETNYVYVQEGDGCWSNVGMIGGKQTINLSKNCDTGAIIHEIGHTIGLFHEQTRHDRDLYVTIMWDQIIEDKKSNFQIPSSLISEDVRGYDYSSIMHYGKDAFATGKNPTIVPLENVEIGQRNGLSVDDISTVASMYGAKSLIYEELQTL